MAMGLLGLMVALVCVAGVAVVGGHGPCGRGWGCDTLSGALGEACGMLEYVWSGVDGRFGFVVGEIVAWVVVIVVVVGVGFQCWGLRCCVAPEVEVGWGRRQLDWCGVCGAGLELL